MDKKFQDLVEGLHSKYMDLMRMTPVMMEDTAPANSPKAGVYLFSENGKHLYAGRTKRRIHLRLRDHVSSSDDCPFAWRLAREATGREPRKCKYDMWAKMTR